MIKKYRENFLSRPDSNNTMQYEDESIIHVLALSNLLVSPDLRPDLFLERGPRCYPLMSIHLWLATLVAYYVLPILHSLSHNLSNFAPLLMQLVQNYLKKTPKVWFMWKIILFKDVNNAKWWKQSLEKKMQCQVVKTDLLEGKKEFYEDA